MTRRWRFHGFVLPHEQAAQDRLGMLAGDGGKVDCGAADRRERLPPQRAEQHRAHDRESMDARIARADLALALGALDQAGDQGHALQHDVVVPDLGELGEVARFADHHLHHPADRGGGRPARRSGAGASGSGSRTAGRARRRSARSPRYWGSPPGGRRRGRCRSWSRNRDRACPWRRRRAPRSPRSAPRQSPSRRTRAAPRRRCRSGAPPCVGAISERGASSATR